MRKNAYGQDAIPHYAESFLRLGRDSAFRGKRTPTEIAGPHNAERRPLQKAPVRKTREAACAQDAIPHFAESALRQKPPFRTMRKAACAQGAIPHDAERRLRTKPAFLTIRNCIPKKSGIPPVEERRLLQNLLRQECPAAPTRASRSRGTSPPCTRQRTARSLPSR